MLHPFNKTSRAFNTQAFSGRIFHLVLTDLVLTFSIQLSCKLHFSKKSTFVGIRISAVEIKSDSVFEERISEHFHPLQVIAVASV